MTHGCYKASKVYNRSTNVAPAGLTEYIEMADWDLCHRLTVWIRAGLINAIDHNRGVSSTVGEGDSAPKIFHTVALQITFHQNTELFSSSSFFLSLTHISPFINPPPPPAKATLTLNPLPPSRSFTYTHKALPSPILPVLSLSLPNRIRVETEAWWGSVLPHRFDWHLLGE